MIDLYDKGKAKFDWWQDWRGECVAIVASGPSAKHAGVEQLKDRIHVVAINENIRLVPFADVLYSCDAEWWTIRSKDEKQIKNFPGVKIGFEVHINGINRIDIKKRKPMDYTHELQFDEPGVLGSGGNSGFQTINLAVQFGATGIAMIGFDMRLDSGMHWHGAHKPPMRNPDEVRCALWAKHLDAAAVRLKDIGVDVVNCSPVSRLEKYPKLNIEQTLQRWNL
jgi:hypothetical protein